MGMISPPDREDLSGRRPAWVRAARRLGPVGCVLLALIAVPQTPSARFVAAAGVTPTPRVVPGTLRLCMSFPFGVAAYAERANGMRRGIQLAGRQWKGRMAGIGITLGTPREFDNARADGGDYSTDQERQNALTCLADPHAIAYIGTMNSGATAISEPILNNAGMVMISPASTSTSLTDPALRAVHEPATLHHKFKYVTFYRTVTTDSLQGPAGAAYMKKALGINRYFLIDDKHNYGAGLASRFDRYARTRLHMSKIGGGQVDPTSAASIAETADAVVDQVVSSKPQAVYFGGNSPQGGPLLRRLRARAFTGPFLGGSALLNRAFVTENGAAAAQTFTTAIGPDVTQTSTGFRAAFKKVFPGKMMGPYDATAYDAAYSALTALYNAKKAGALKGNISQKRAALLPFMSAIKVTGATGVTAFDKNGDTTNRIISIYSVTNGKWKFRGTAPILAIPSVP